jgi:hypothetical protein
MPITCDTTVGKLIPEGKDCNGGDGCSFLVINGHASLAYCVLPLGENTRLEWQGGSFEAHALIKHQSCPKPPVEVKK